MVERLADGKDVVWVVPMVAERVEQRVYSKVVLMVASLVDGTVALLDAQTVDVMVDWKAAA